MKKMTVNFWFLPFFLLLLMFFGSSFLSAETYIWNQNGSATFNAAANWTPNRISPAADDILVFDNGASITVTGISDQTIGGLLVSNNTKVTLNSSGIASTLTINNGISGNDFSVASGCELNIAQTTSNSALIIAIATGAVGSVSGSMDFSSATASTPNQITSADASGLTFNSGAVFTQNTNNSGNVFGSGKANSVIFSSGSTFVQYTGANPFQKSGSSVVVFQTGSLFKMKNNTGASFSGRTYANLEYDNSGTLSPEGTSSLSIDNLTITNGTFNFNMTGTSGHYIKGNFAVASGATLNFKPDTESASTIYLNGSSTQTISGLGTLTVASNASFVVNSDVIVDKNIIFGGALTINLGKSLTVNPAKQLTVTGTLTNNGTINLLSDVSGTATIKTTATISGSGSYTMKQYLPSYRTWYMTSPMIGTTNKPLDNNSSYPALLKWFDESKGEATGWTDVTSTGMTSGIGYMLNPGTTSGASTLNFSGTINSDNQSIALTGRTGTADKAGFNLIGNPFPAYLDWKLVCDNVSNAAKMRSKTMWYRTKDGSFAFHTVNGASGEGTPATASRYIPPMQAFWVRAVESVSGTLAFNTDMRTDAPATNNLLKAPAQKNSENQKLRVLVSNGVVNDEILIYTNTSALNGYDAYDSPKMLNGSTSTVPDIYTLVGTEQLVINGMNEIPYDVEIPLYFKRNASTANSYTLRANEISNFTPGTLIYIKNNNTGIKSVISDGSAYVFEPTNLGNPAFSLIIKAPESTTDIRNTSSDDISIYVNKNRQISVTSKNGIVGGTISIYNAVGQLQLSETLVQSTTLIEKSFTPGVYMVSVSVAGKTNTQKVILN